MKNIFLLCVGLALLLSLATPGHARPLTIKLDQEKGTITVYRIGESEPILTQNARADHRPYLHPIVAPDGKGLLTEYSPGHHKHQTGVYWGFTRVNGRDYFHHPEGTYWRRVSFEIVPTDGSSGDVRWRTVYDMLDAKGGTVLRETQTWSMKDLDKEYEIDLVWQGEAKTNVTIGKYDYGGLFIRMPWKSGIDGDVVNGARQKNRRAEGQRAPWVDIGMKVEGRTDRAHIAMFDHGKNNGFPQHWRVDGQLGAGPIRAREGDWHIAKGKTATYRHRLLAYTGELNDHDLTEKWKAYSGVHGTWALWGIAQREGRDAKFLSPDEAVKAMTLQPGFEVNAWASEPMITQPMAFCWDDRGRMWIAENRDYESRGHGFSNSGDSRILIIEDTDKDGVADSRKVFSEGIPFPAGIAVGMGGLWLGAPPNLLFLPDKDGDDKADGDVEVRLTGWGIRDRHETLNSFHWGPDGWLYGCQGFATPSRVGKPKGKGRLYKHKEPFPKNIEFEGQPVDINGGVWRYHPTKDRFEVVAHGFSNPWGLDYDAKGQLFISACVIPHLWHVIPGGIYHRQGGQHFNRHVYSDIRTITDHRHRSAHGGARVYISDAFPEKYHGRLFMANIHEHAVLTDILEPQGSGFVGKHGDDLLHANNAQWIGFSMEIGPEGAAYVLDWHDADICGKDVLQKETGRIFRITPKKSLAKNWEGRYGDLAKLGDKALASLQTSKSAWHARRARVLLQGRSYKRAIDADAQSQLRETFATHENSDYRLRAMWALHVSGGVGEKALVSALDDRDAHIRAWAIQLLCEDFKAPAAALAKFAAMAKADTSAVVRLYLAAAMQRVDENSRWSIAKELVQHDEDGDDHNIPKMIWFAIEPDVTRDAKRAIALAQGSKIPMLTRFVARRLADEEKLDELVASLETSSSAQVHLLLGMRDGLDGNEVKAPASWAKVYANLLAGAGAQERDIAVELAQQLGDAAASETLLGVLGDSKASVEARGRALRGLASQRFAELPPKLISLLDDDAMRIEAIRAMAAFDDEELTKLLLDGYAKFSEKEKAEAINTLASRPKSGWQLALALKSGAISKRDVPAYIARQLRRAVGNGFVEIWGPIDAVSAEKDAEFDKYRKLLTDEAVAAADASRGRGVFDRTCQRCHTMYDLGGKVGPDITGANRGDLNYILGNILSPSDVIQDAYKMTIVLTNQGRVYSGILAGESKRQIKLRVPGQEDPVSIRKSRIASRELASVSMMPEGLLKNLSDAEVLDLIAYLRTAKQVPVAASGAK